MDGCYKSSHLQVTGLFFGFLHSTLEFSEFTFWRLSLLDLQVIGYKTPLNKQRSKHVTVIKIFWLIIHGLIPPCPSSISTQQSYNVFVSLLHNSLPYWSQSHQGSTRQALRGPSAELQQEWHQCKWAQTLIHFLERSPCPLGLFKYWQIIQQIKNFPLRLSNNLCVLLKFPEAERPWARV